VRLSKLLLLDLNQRPSD